MAVMTKLLKQVSGKVRELPEADQNEVAEFLTSVVSRKGRPVELDDDTRKAIR